MSGLLKKLRPSKYLLRNLFLIREHAAAVAFRPISFENQSYLLSRIDEINKLRNSLLDQKSVVRPYWRKVIDKVSSAVDRSANDPRQSVFAQIVKHCDDSGYMRYWTDAIAYAPMSRIDFTNRKVDNVWFVFGPALGLGDEISAVSFTKDVMKNHSRADHRIFSYYPDLWTTLLPGRQVFSLEGNPGLLFEQMDNGHSVKENETHLLVFINFSGIEFYKLFYFDKTPPAVLEIAIGKGRMWFFQHASCPVYVAERLDPVIPNNYTALSTLSGLVGIQKEKNHSHRKASPNESDMIITVNPFTSKHILLTGSDWVKLLKMSLDELPEDLRLKINLLPGMSERSQNFAMLIKKGLEEALTPQKKVTILNNGRHLHSKTAFQQVYQSVAASQFVLGIDTYTAHLSGLLNIPSLAICYGRNKAFWSESPSSYWLEINEDPGVLALVIRFVLDTALTIHLPQKHGVDAATREFAGNFKNSLLKYGTQPSEIRWRQIIADGDHFWQGLPGSAREALGELDKNYSWDRISPWLQDQTRGISSEWRMNLLTHLHFTKTAFNLDTCYQ